VGPRALAVLKLMIISNVLGCCTGARDRAAREWCAWEDAHVSLTPGHAPNPRYQDPEFRLRIARLVTHYWQHAAFLKEDQLIRDAPKLNGIPGVLIHGRSM
jgi:proline iminopeptidase